jgi:hypothetical protein
MLRAAFLLAITVPTAQYDNARTGANLHETVLTPKNVNAAQFGRLWNWTVDGDVYAQPLYMPGLEIPGKGVHDVVFVATEHNGVYAFDAASKAEPLWRVSFLGPGVTTVPARNAQCPFISPEIGVTGTPVIDAASKTLYVLARTMESGERVYQRLHALDLATGAERPGSPVLIRATVTVPGLLGILRREIAFHSLFENPRAALLLANGRVYLSWGSACDVMPYYGWVLAYDARTLQQVGVFNTAPDAGESGIWQGDAGIAADQDGSVYAVTGNGKFTAATGGRDYGDSILKLGFANGALAVRDYFTPYNQARLNSTDADLGSSGPVLLPDQPGPHPHLLAVGGKGGTLYLVDRDRMGGYRADSDAHAVQAVIGAGKGFGAAAYWNGHLYYFPTRGLLKDFTVANGRLATPPREGLGQVNDSGAIPVVSANGAKDGIVWVVVADGTLRAYDAADIGRTLVQVPTNGAQLRFTMPTVAGGRVYVGLRNQVAVFGARVAIRGARGFN